MVLRGGQSRLRLSRCAAHNRADRSRYRQIGRLVLKYVVDVNVDDEALRVYERRAVRVLNLVYYRISDLVYFIRKWSLVSLRT